MTLAEIQARFERSPFISFLGLVVLEADHDKGRVKMRMPMRPEFERQANADQIHGGIISALIDTAGDYALIMTAGVGIPTINFRTDYLSPAKAGDLIAVAEVRKRGRSISVVDIEIRDASDKLIALGRGTYSTAVVPSAT
ncbi:MAG TPA: PaaI family thioesterase [Xanthobacteraceae bacterium]|nr:PaaI family thioesterase [Xanthobacteraceae bacterium]